jgi:hypothetical protein
VSGHRLSRARFVAAAIGVATPVALAPLRPWRRLVELERRTPARRLAELLRHPAGARAVGAEYLRARPGAATAAALVDELVGGLPGGHAVLAAASDRELRALLAARGSEDFEQGRTVVVRGWILSETEVRLCALAALVGA